MVQDAAAKEALGWEWSTGGYGQVLFKLVQVRGGGRGGGHILVMQQA
jgi:hypothetical protein